VTVDLGGSWREVYAALDCPTSAHDELHRPETTDADGGHVTGVTTDASGERLKALGGN